ncbi:MAG: hypothetical protein GF421_02840 [Candidatus Aminicenantes bacterium]|nr:hypothetical protein [Candidatus Aminicenantes bacterium]
MGHFIRSMTVIVVFIGMVFSISYSQMRFSEDKQKGTLTVYEGSDPVLTYCYADQLKEGRDPKQIRSCYIHPLYSLDGTILTDDFPSDHPHHHGVFWTWPVVGTKGQDTQTWHPDTPPLRQHFNQWLEKKADSAMAVLSVENLWKLDDKQAVAKETLTLCVHLADQRGRAVDFELVIEAVGGELKLQGSPEQNKGYGGLCFRGAPAFQGAVMTTDQGELKQDVTHQSFQWADLSTEESGLTVFVSPEHPDFPPAWLIRNSYAGVLNVSWPGLDPVVLKPGEAVTLCYRIYIHRGDASAGGVNNAYQEYLLKCK